VLVHTLGRWRRSVCSSVLIDIHVHHALHHGLENELVVVLAVARSLLVLVRFERCEQAVDALGEAIVDDALILERLNLMAAVVALLVYLCLFRANEGLLVDVGVNFDVAVVRELQVVLCAVSRSRRDANTQYHIPICCS
jgi:hypothetical protein